MNKQPTYVKVIVQWNELHRVYDATANLYHGKKTNETMTLSRNTDYEALEALDRHFAHRFGCHIYEVPFSVQTVLL